MTRYSASRGIRYTAPPGPDGSRRDADDEETAGDSAAEFEGDGRGETGDSGVAADD